MVVVGGCRGGYVVRRGRVVVGVGHGRLVGRCGRRWTQDRPGSVEGGLVHYGAKTTVEEQEQSRIIVNVLLKFSHYNFESCFVDKVSKFDLT